MRRRVIAAQLAGLALTAATFALAPLGGGIAMPAFSIDGGGGRAAAGALIIQGTIGQPDAGETMTGGAFALRGGLAGGGAETAPCPADVDGSGDVGFDDLLLVLAAWGDCPGCPEDIDGDGAVGFSDLLAVLGGWGDCP